LGPFHRFQPKDTIEWFESRGVFLKTEADGRMFPVTDNSETIIECLVGEAGRLGVEICFKRRVERIEKEGDHFVLYGKEGAIFECKKLILATGSSVDGHGWAAHLGHTIQPPVPSLFTFNVPDSPLSGLSGVSFEKVRIQIEGTTLFQEGPLLITHFGFSGPAALKLSAWGARYLNEKTYSVRLVINWLPALTLAEITAQLHALKSNALQQTLVHENLFRFPKSFWKTILGSMGEQRLNDISLKALGTLAEKLHGDRYQVNGKTTHKEEFVTCGGVTLKEVNFKTMESKVCPGLFFAGEILDIDGVTGGFNFQNAWTSGFLAGSSAL
jgi:hypothetical protein